MNQAGGDLDETDLHRRLKGKRTRLERLATVFFQHHQGQLEALNQALQDNQAEELRRAAHTYKGTVGSFSARHSVELCQQLEGLSREAKLQEAAPLIKQLNDLAQQLKARLEQLPQEPEWSDG